jgi:two-component system nitrogen regulation response regulator GlnG
MPSPLADVSTVNFGQENGAQGPRLVPALTIVSHPVPSRAGERLLLRALADGKEVALSRNAPEFSRPGHSSSVPLNDPSVSRKPITFAPGARGGVRLRVEDGGTHVVMGEPVQGSRELGPEAVAAGVALELGGRVVLLLHQVDLSIPDAKDTLGMVGESSGVRRVRRHIEQVADLDVPVLVRGETGSGKELVARAIHERSRRKDGPFVSVNLGALPKELAAAELFGARKGAYTGATQDREGFFRAAEGGTLFLDEVGEASTEVQVMLLRVLESGELYPVGGQRPVRTDVRLIAATDALLEEQIREGSFKAPLMHRLAGYSIRVPPLRERREDLGPLFIHFAREELEALGEAHRLAPGDAFAEPWLPASLAAWLVRYDWPGNIRQLRNAARQLVIGSRGQPRLVLDPQLARELEIDLPTPGRPPEAPPPRDSKPVGGKAPPPVERVAPRRKPSEISEQELISTLRACGWDLQATADRLGLPRSSIYDLIDKSPHLRTAGDLSNEEITRCFQECGGDLDAMAQRLEVSRRGLLRRVKDLGLTPKES